MSFENVGRDTNEQPPARPGDALSRRGPNAALIAFVVVVALAATFVLQNNDNEVRTHFLWYTTTSKVWPTIGIAIAIGIALDRLASMWWHHRRRKGL